MLIAKSDHIGC